MSGEDWLDGIVHSEIETSVYNDTDARDNETSVKSGKTVGSKSLLVNINDSVELFFSTTLLGTLGIISQSSSGEIKRINYG